MSVEDHPKYPEWRSALENLIDAVDARKADDATDADVEKAKNAYRKIADDIHA